MRNRQLHDALLRFCEEAAWQLAADACAGADVPYEVVETGRSESSFYCYRPLTADFIDQRRSLLGRLPSYGPALHALGASPGLPAYLRAQGEAAVGGRAGAIEALRRFLATVFRDSTDFVLDRGRFDRDYAELERLVMEGRTLTEVVAVLHGLVISSPRLELGAGLTLLRADAREQLPPGAGDALVGRPGVIARLEWEAAAGDEAPLHHAQVRFAALLAGLRLYDATRMRLGRTAWVRSAGDPWQPLALAGEGRARGVCVVPELQEDELRAFLSLIARRAPASGELAWALRRFGRACDAQRPSEALTDALLALRALLEPEGPQSGKLPGRLAVLCAIPSQRAVVTERVAHYCRTERDVVAGAGPADESLEPAVDELLGWLRALLRDVLCGHLAVDLVAVSERLFAEEEARQQTLA